MKFPKYFKNKIIIGALAIIILFLTANIIRVNRRARMEFSEKLAVLRDDVKNWIGKGNNPAKIVPLMKKLEVNLKAKKFPEVENIINEVQSVIEPGGEERVSAETNPFTISGSYEKINIVNGVVRNGMGDPSIEYGPDGIGWLTYTSVDIKNSVLTTHLAKSENGGKAWKFVKTLNRPEPDVVDGAEGNWVRETSSIVYDPDDSGKEWKVFWFKYFRAKDSISKPEKHNWINSWIAFRYASDPEGEWSEEIPVFGMGNYREKGIDLSALHSDLEDLVFYYELGSLYADGVLYLSLEGSASPMGKGKWDKRKIILLTSVDHGKIWKYAGTLIGGDDARSYGYLTFTASSLAEEKGRKFLFASPSGKISDLNNPEGHHDGTFIFEFENIAEAKLKRDGEGKLALIKRIDDNLEKGGQADYDEQNVYGGIVIPQQDLKYYPEIFQLFSTKEKIID